MTMERDSLVARLEEAQEWMREPDWAENFSLTDIADWLNKRPTSVIPKAIAEIKNLEAAAALSRPEQVVTDEMVGAVNDLSALVDLVVEETLGPSVEDEPDNESVGGTSKGPLPMTFGHVRRAQEAIAVIRSCLTTAAPLQADASAPVSPAIGVQAVTDEMVERACRAYAPDLFGDDAHAAHVAASPWEVSHAQAPIRQKMRAALEAALHPAPEAASEGGADRIWRLPTVEATLAEMLSVATGGEGEIDSEWLSEQRAAVDLWQASIRSAIVDTAPSPKGVSDGVRDVLDERRRQIEAEGWTPEHDDQHAGGEIAAAAAAYAFSAFNGAGWRAFAADPIGFWPWNVSWWKPTTPRRDLVKAGALIIAEIERLDRLSPATAEERAASKEGA